MSTVPFSVAPVELMFVAPPFVAGGAAAVAAPAPKIASEAASAQAAVSSRTRIENIIDRISAKFERLRLNRVVPADAHATIAVNRG